MLVIQLGPMHSKSAPNAFESLFSNSPMLFLLLSLCLKLAVSLQTGILGQEAGSNNNNGATTSTHATTTLALSSACDLFLRQTSSGSANEQLDSPLTNYCHCKDAESNTLGAGFGVHATVSNNDKQTKVATAATTSQPPSLTILRINQLNCSPANLTQLTQDLRATMLARNEGFAGKFQVDYLSIDTNIINLKASKTINHKREDLSTQNQLFVDYMSLELSLPDLQQATNSGQENGKIYTNNNRFEEESNTDDRGHQDHHDHGKTSTIPDQAQYLASVERQMIDFGSLVNELHLQSLSVRFILTTNHDEEKGTKEREEDKEMEPAIVGGYNFKASEKQTSSHDERRQKHFRRLKLDKFLAKYSNLIKLELSSNKHRSNMDPDLYITSNTFKYQTQLKWLNLASNAKLRLNLDEINIEDGSAKYLSPFITSNSLEYLNLERNGLKKFPIFSMLSPSNTDNFSTEQHNCLGLVNLTSLNLAGNKLNSFENDLFTSFEALKRQTTKLDNELNICLQTSSLLKGNKQHYNLNCPSKVFLLPSLTQLDLSYNKLTGLAPKVGQYLLCTMPNLNQLYLQNNKIFHLNLNSLLTYPTILPDSTNLASNTGFNRKSSTTFVTDAIYSRLEYIDLSYNNLLLITAATNHPNITDVKAPSSVGPVRIKSIDLSNNNLKRPFNRFDVELINYIIFEESFRDSFDLSDKYDKRTNSFTNLEENFLLFSNNSPSTICDFLSPTSVRLHNNLDLLNEVILTSNNLDILSRDDFSSQQCRDVQILRLSRNHISIIENEALFSLHNLEHLDLNHNSIYNLLENTFNKNLKLRILNLSYNRLKSLQKNVFLHLTNLEELLLNGNEISAFSNDLIAQNQELITLDLSENRIAQLDQSLFSNLKHLRFLNLHSNLLKHFSQHLFYSNKPSISSIIIGQNEKYNLVESSMLKREYHKHKKGKHTNKLNNLKSKKTTTATKRKRQVYNEDSNLLILTLNQIDSFEFENCSSFGKNIQTLWLDNNLLREIKKLSLNCLIKIQRINLQSNRIKIIDEEAFSHSNQLEYIDLSRNELKHIQSSTFGFSPELRHIDLSSNQLRDINLINVFKSKSNPNEIAQLETLNLSENNDLRLDINDLCDFLDSLSMRQVHFGHIGQIINVGNNRSTITFKTKDLPPFEIMNISSIHRIDDQLFSLLNDPKITIEKLDLTSIDIVPEVSSKLMSILSIRLKNGLLELDISGNYRVKEQILRLFNEMIFQSKLNVLDISSNRIEFWPFDKNTADKFQDLRVLNLSKNKLRHFIGNYSHNSYIFHQLETLNLSSNALIGLVENPTIGIRNLRSLMPNMRQLDLSNNRLSWIPNGFLNDLNDLTWLKLDNNHLETFPAVYTNSRLILDLSFNTKLKSIVSKHDKDENIDEDDHMMGEEDEEGEEEEEDFFGGLILYDDHSSSVPQVVCQSIHEFKINNYELMYKHSHSFDTTNLEMMKDLSSFMQDNDDKIRADDERCNEIIRMIASIKLDSISPYLNLHSINIDKKRQKYLHLNLHRNNLNQIITNDRNNKNIIQLDMSDNRIQEIPNSLCIDLPKLRSLDLSKNFLKEYPTKTTANCLKLNYLDLSFNKITSLSGIDIIGFAQKSTLMVLKLQHNSIVSLNARYIRSLESLRFIDLRFNQLKYDQILPLLRNSQLLTVISDYKLPPQELLNYSRLPQIKMTNTSLFVDWHSQRTVNNNNNNLISWRVLYDNDGLIENNTMVSYQTNQLIKLCTLSADNWTEICTKIPDDDQYRESGKCFNIKRPNYMPSCYTKLIGPSVEVKNNSPADSSHLISLTTNLDNNNNLSESKLDDDLVLTLIDSMKRSWLKFKEIDLNNYIASVSNIKGDTIWVLIDGKYPIYTLTIVKIAIVGGSVCIIGLLIAMFTLLTYLSKNDNNTRNHHSSPRCSSELTNITSETDTSGSSTINKCSISCNSEIKTQSSLQQSSNQTCSNTTNNSGSTSKDDTQLQTVLERKISSHHKKQHYQQLDAGQLYQQQQLACSTPSSSLAPSSVETAETLQAIDSIQSGASISQYNNLQAIGKDCVDQYSDLYKANDGLVYDNNHLNSQVATVMRIVKSNSANCFDHSSNHRPILGKDSYATVNYSSNRHQNQSSLRSKIRALQEHHQHKHQVYPSFTVQGTPTGYYSQAQSAYGYDNNNNNMAPINQCFEGPSNNETVEHHHEGPSTLVQDGSIQHDLDPTTMSLLSINTAISNSFRSSASQQVSPAESKSISTGINDQQSNLCSYHRLTRDQSAINGEQLGQAASVILEQEEEQYPGNLVVLDGGLPPPPPSRAIEELESQHQTQYLSSSSNQQSNYFYNRV